MKNKAILSLSGGLDSTTLLYHIVKDLKRDVIAVNFNYGQNNAKEIEFAKYHCDSLDVEYRQIDLTDYFKQVNHSSSLLSGAMSVSKGDYSDKVPDTYVSHRNLLFTLIMASIAEQEKANELYLGIDKVDSFNGYWDTSSEFVKRVQAVLDLNPSNSLKLVTPFVEMLKPDEIKIGMRLGLDYSKTMTCYRGTNCGDCASCNERISAFESLGLKDSINYG